MIIALLAIGLVVAIAMLVVWNDPQSFSERVLCSPNGCASFD
jgi:hypothetical protein